MRLIFGLMLLLKTAACVERLCWFNESDPCHAALGDKLNLNLMMWPDLSRYDLKIRKIISNTHDDPVCRVKDNRIRENECDLFNNRPEVSVINGILIINRVIRADSGIYRLDLFTSEGRETSRDLQVIVEVPPVAPIVLGCLAVILIVLVIVAYYFYKKRNQLKPTPNVSDGPECVNEHVAQKKPHTEEEQKRPVYFHETVYCTMPGGCRFNERWLEDAKYALWIKRRVASCKVYKKDVQLFTMGESALSSHMKGKKHQDLSQSSQSCKRKTKKSGGCRKTAKGAQRHSFIAP